MIMKRASLRGLRSGRAAIAGMSSSVVLAAASKPRNFGRLFGAMTAPLPVASDKPAILVIDDGRDNRLLLSAMLSRAGYQPLVAEHGEAGLALLGLHTPALVLLDYSMPGLDGPAVARRIRARVETRDTPIIVLTASSEVGHMNEAFAAGANAYVVKPFDRRDILARIELMIRAAAARQVSPAPHGDQDGR